MKRKLTDLVVVLSFFILPFKDLLNYPGRKWGTYITQNKGTVDKVPY